ncbi:hypothetical protein D3C75_839720 [compost metagenome]
MQQLSTQVGFGRFGEMLQHVVGILGSKTTRQFKINVIGAQLIQKLAQLIAPIGIGKVTLLISVFKAQASGDSE